MAGFFILLSIFGVFVGAFMVSQGLFNDGMGSILTFIIGVFVMIKEVMDMMFAA